MSSVAIVTKYASVGITLCSVEWNGNIFHTLVVIESTYVTVDNGFCQVENTIDKLLVTLGQRI